MSRSGAAMWGPCCRAANRKRKRWSASLACGTTTLLPSCKSSLSSRPSHLPRGSIARRTPFHLPRRPWLVTRHDLSISTLLVPSLAHSQTTRAARPLRPDPIDASPVSTSRPVPSCTRRSHHVSPCHVLPPVRCPRHRPPSTSPLRTASPLEPRTFRNESEEVDGGNADTHGGLLRRSCQETSTRRKGRPRVL